jgi:uncharacterized protein
MLLYRKLRIKSDEIQEGGLLIRENLPPSWFLANSEGREDLLLVAPISVDLLLSRSEGKIRIKGLLKTRGRPTCSRCLEEVDLSISAPIDLTLYAGSIGPYPKELELTAKDLDYDTYDGEEIDLSDTIYEGIVLAYPMKPLCSEDCRGLCPGCGTNFNKKQCSCEKEEGAHRFRALKNLKTKYSKGEK